MDKPEAGSDEESDADHDAIAHRLKQDALEKTVRFHRRIADGVLVDEEKTLVYRPHRFTPVCVAFSKTGRFVVSCSKDGSVVKCKIGLLGA